MKLTHMDNGGPSMVDVGDKDETTRTAKAACIVRVGEEAAAAIRQGSVKKGSPLAVAELAGIMGAKKTPELIPLCHPLGIDHVAVRCRLVEDRVEISASVRSTGRTGVEMEAMTAAAIAGLTVYDMCKSVSKGITIEEIRLVEKTGGKSGTYSAG
ncbi:MAG: cyclic pyranopterin monophosphate synthase MoaC [Pseudomonadota bacterium]